MQAASIHVRRKTSLHRAQCSETLHELPHCLCLYLVQKELRFRVRFPRKFDSHLVERFQCLLGQLFLPLFHHAGQEIVVLPDTITTTP